jgi:hypothetical protein
MSSTARDVVQRAGPKRARDVNRRVVYVNAVLWAGVKTQARREHRTVSGYVCWTLEKALGWADEDEE